MRNEEVPGPQLSPNDFRKVLRKKHAAGPTLTAQMSGNLLFEIKGIKNLADSGTEHDVWVTPALCPAPVAGRPGENPIHTPESARYSGNWMWSTSLFRRPPHYLQASHLLGERRSVKPVGGANNAGAGLLLDCAYSQ
jgi:hypothetical protein